MNPNLPTRCRLVYDDGDGLRVVDGTLTNVERVELDLEIIQESRYPRITVSRDPSYYRFTIDGEVHEARECKITWEMS